MSDLLIPGGSNLVEHVNQNGGRVRKTSHKFRNVVELTTFSLVTPGSRDEHSFSTECA
jgi:hypothetical protein